MDFPNAEKISDKFDLWWKNQNTGAPLMRIIALLDSPSEPLETETESLSPEGRYTDVDELSLRFRNHLRTTRYYASAYPNMSIDLGPGSLALYLGSEPDFKRETVWFKECVTGDLSKQPLPSFDPGSKWFQRHLQMAVRAKELARGKYLVNIPDLIENIDILSAMRGPRNLCLDLRDCPETVMAFIERIDSLYFSYYDSFADILRDDRGRTSFTAFNIWGKGRTAKIQCDFAALIGENDFDYFVKPGLSAIADKLDNAIFHLDGPQAIRHLDSICDIKGLNAVQFTHLHRERDGLSPAWYTPIYDKLYAAGKGMIITAAYGGADDWIRGIDALLSRYSSRGLYFYLPFMSVRDAEKLCVYSEAHWE